MVLLHHSRRQKRAAILLPAAGTLVLPRHRAYIKMQGALCDPADSAVAQAAPWIGFMAKPEQRQGRPPGAAGVASPCLVGRRQWLAGAAGLGLTALLPRAPRAETSGDVAATSEGDIRFFRIGTGSTAGTYYPVGGLLAAAISNPPGSHPCNEGGSCGVPGLLAVAQSTNGSVDNVKRMLAGKLESGLCQADVAFWAASGEGVFKDQGPIDSLRVISSLYPEVLHLVAHRQSAIRSLADLKGKRVSLDREGSGTRVDALLLLAAAGLKPGSYEEMPMGAAQAAQALREETLDAFFMMAGTPASAIAELASEGLMDLVPIDGPAVEKLTADYPFFTVDAVTAGTYMNAGQTPTLSVRALWLVSASVDAELVYQITAALWHPTTRELLDMGHIKARSIRLETALSGVTQPPLHEGALRWYREAGIEGL